MYLYYFGAIYLTHRLYNSKKVIQILVVYFTFYIKQMTFMSWNQR